MLVQVKQAYYFCARSGEEFLVYPCLHSLVKPVQKDDNFFSYPAQMVELVDTPA